MLRGLRGGPAPLRVVAHRIGRRAGQDEVRAQPVGDVVGKAVEHAERVLQPVPARYLEHDRS